MPRGHSAKTARKYKRAGAKGKVATSITQSGNAASHGKRTFKQRKGTKTDTLTMPITFDGRFYKIDMLIICVGDKVEHLTFTSIKLFPNPADPTNFKRIGGERDDAMVCMFPTISKKLEAKGYRTQTGDDWRLGRWSAVNKA